MGQLAICRCFRSERMGILRRTQSAPARASHTRPGTRADEGFAVAVTVHRQNASMSLPGEIVDRIDAASEGSRTWALPTILSRRLSVLSNLPGSRGVSSLINSGGGGASWCLVQEHRQKAGVLV